MDESHKKRKTYNTKPYQENETKIEAFLKTEVNHSEKKNRT